MAQHIQATLCDTTCKAIVRYYKHLDPPYDGLLSKFCEENGLDDDHQLMEEMETDASDCVLLDFDDNFPFEKEEMTKEEKEACKHNLIRKCMKNPNYQFGGSIPILSEESAELFNLTKTWRI
eukprot:883006_1